MSPRDRILEAAMTVFRRHGFRRSSIEETAEAAGLTRQALYHHFKSKEALFRAVIERCMKARCAEMAPRRPTHEAAGGSLADIIVAEVAARLKAFSPPSTARRISEELFSEHLLQARDLYQLYAALHDAQVATTIDAREAREAHTRLRHDASAKLTR